MVLGAKDLGKVALLKKKKFNVVNIEKQKSMVAKFPLRNALSYAIGPTKGYPALMKHMKEKGYKMAVPYEIYDMAAGKILYIMEIVK
jgi:hypothetical protein